MNEYLKKCCLIIFLRNIIPGKIEHPLSAVIGEENAFRLSMALVNNLKSVAQNIPVAKHIYYDTFIDEQDEWNDSNCKKYLQLGNSTGEKMENAFRNSFTEGYSKVVFIGSDCAKINSKYIEEAFLSLKIIEFCIGPDDQGGYYLIGMNHFEPLLFKDKDFTSPLLAKSTIRDIGNLKEALYKLHTLERISSKTDPTSLNS